MQDVWGSNPRLDGLQVSPLQASGGISTLQSRAFGLQSATQSIPSGPKDSSESTHKPYRIRVRLRVCVRVRQAWRSTSTSTSCFGALEPKPRGVVVMSRSGVHISQRGNKCHNPDFLGFSKQQWLLRGSWGVIRLSFVCLLNERFWGCLKSHATIPLLKYLRYHMSMSGSGMSRTLCICVYLSLYTYTCICVYIYIYICIGIKCMYMCVYIYI